MSTMKRILSTVAATAMTAGVVAVAQPAAANSEIMSCSYSAENPTNDGSNVRGEGSASGSCATWGANLKRERPWSPDQVLDSADQSGEGTIALVNPCNWDSSWGIYVEAYGSQSSTATSDVIEMIC